MRRHLVAGVVLGLLASLGALAAQCDHRAEARVTLTAAHNGYRRDHALPEFFFDPRLAEIAQVRAEELAQTGVLTHTRPDGTTVFTLMAQRGVYAGWAGENIGFNTYGWPETIGRMMQAWIDSTDHRHNLENPHYNRIGIGYATGSGGSHWYAVVFGG